MYNEYLYKEETERERERLHIAYAILSLDSVLPDPWDWDLGMSHAPLMSKQTCKFEVRIYRTH